MDGEFVTMSNGGFQMFLVRWKDCHSKDELYQLAPKLLKNYLPKNSSKSSSFHLEKMIENEYKIY